MSGVNVQRRGDPPALRWLVCPQQRLSAATRLFCLPHAGGGTVAYRPWFAHLPERIELGLVQLPGRETRIREQPYTRMAPLIADLVPALEPLLDRPYALFGHSMGALVAFELARALRRLGAPLPVCLIVSGRRGPQLADPDPPMHQLPDDQFVAEMARRYSGIPRFVLDDEALMDLFLPTLRADLAVIETYRYVDEQPLACPVVALGGQQDCRASYGELLAWQAQTNVTFQVDQLPGDHFYLQSSRTALLAVILRALDAVTPLRPSGAT